MHIIATVTHKNTQLNQSINTTSTHDGKAQTFFFVSYLLSPFHVLLYSSLSNKKSGLSMQIHNKSLCVNENKMKFYIY